jgi:chromosome segregation protein
MRISKIKLAGFKTFVDPTTLPLASNLTGVVGPNGCGKSNVVDALVWVMGESSAKHLRGDSMTDVIFNGTSSRKPIGQASVEILFDNADGQIDGPYAAYTEVSIKRQLARDGTSLYFINGGRCRRRDITDILRGKGLGPRSYAVIEQGMISRVIEARPEELRGFVEEAAGISKYKERRRETENRIRDTRDNLARLTDLRAELMKQAERLERQAKAAETYQKLKQEERVLRAQLLGLRWGALLQEADTHAEDLVARQASLDAVATRARAAETRNTELRAQQTEATQAFNEAQASYYAAGAEVSRLQQAIEHIRERQTQFRQDLAKLEKNHAAVLEERDADAATLAQLEQGLSSAAELKTAAELTERETHGKVEELEQSVHDWQGLWDEANRLVLEHAQDQRAEQARIQHREQTLAARAQRLETLAAELQGLSDQDLDQELAQLRQRYAELESQQTDLQSEHDAKHESLRQLREQADSVAAELETARAHAQDLKARAASLEAVQNMALGGAANNPADTWLKEQGLADAPRLAQQIEVTPGWELAVEAALKHKLGAICVDDLHASAQQVKSLENGTVSIVEARRGEDVKTKPALLARMLSALGRKPLPAPRLSDLVQSAYPIDELSGATYAVEGLKQAYRLRKHLAPHESIVTRTGVRLGRGWLDVERAGESHTSVIGREHELRDLREDSAAAQTEADRIANLAGELRTQLHGQETECQSLRERLQTHQHSVANVRAELTILQDRHTQNRERHAKLTEEMRELERQQSTDSDDLLSNTQRLNTLQAAVFATEGRLETLSAQRDSLHGALAQAREVWRKARERHQSLALSLQSQSAQRDNLSKALERLGARMGELSEQLETTRKQHEEQGAPLLKQQELLEAAVQARSAAEEGLRTARETLTQVDGSLREFERERAQLEQSLTREREELQKLRLAAQGVLTRQQTMREQAQETGIDDLDALLEQIPESAEESETQLRLREIDQRVQRLGAINLAAIDEFNEAGERSRYLESQCEDLNQALLTLEDAIHKIDRETRSRFKETFEQINERFSAMFPRLFGGGQASLILSGEDILDAGVSVIARPPGKRNSTIHLLSGGEKALTAVSLVFAIFELNPAPFCLLDEVDAPLDDANVLRLCDLLKDMSQRVQFLFITHNKITMEIAERLIGVTMQEPGVSRLVAVDVEEAAQMAAAG